MLKIENIINYITYAIIAVCYISVLPHMNMTISVLCILIATVSCYMTIFKKYSLPNVILTSSSVAIIGMAIWKISPDDFAIPALEALALLVAVKSLQQKKFRDYLQIYAMSIFLLAGASLITTDIMFLVYLLVLLFLLNVAIVFLAYCSEDDSLVLDYKEVLSIMHKSSYIAIVSIPLSAVFFLVLPRTDYPFLSFLNVGKGVRSGFTEQVELGRVADIQENSEVIFRAQMRRVRDADLYWRGIVLDYFDGRSWKAGEKSFITDEPITMAGEVAQTIYLEPYYSKYLFALDKPIQIQLRHSKKTDDLNYLAGKTITARTRYLARSVPTDMIHAVTVDRDRYLQLPAGISPKLVKLVGSLLENKTSDQQPRVFLDFLQGSDFSYATQNLPVSEAPVEDFIFQHRYGNCEYFASALAVMLRIAGIPSRLVGGYHGGNYNELGGYYVVSQRQAHLWVEAYTNSGGWLRLDPTPARAVSMRSSTYQHVVSKLGKALDVVNYHWNMLILNYNFKTQLEIANSLARKKREFQSILTQNMWWPMAAGIASGCVILVYRILTVSRMPASNKLVRRFVKKMKKYGYTRNPNEGLDEFLWKIQDETLRERAHRFVSSFQRTYYRDEEFTHKQTKALKRLLTEL
jgi:protein-glutamine gamma-glutamyltransferase